ncbi:hypothetical protein UPYG_G00265470 [Umbra pygmaea]|uniref:Uncharacterized protein n=1 Tax=Umbra pygmaea TaxID=75934 RepID=A0ABD0W9T2_UMBPY
MPDPLCLPLSELSAGEGTSSTSTPGTSDTQARNTQPASGEEEGTSRTTLSTQGNIKSQPTETRDTILKEVTALNN